MVAQPSREELIRRASDMVPALRERAAEAERERKVPQQTIDDLHVDRIRRSHGEPRQAGIGSRPAEASEQRPQATTLREDRVGRPLQRSASSAYSFGLRSALPRSSSGASSAARSQPARSAAAS